MQQVNLRRRSVLCVPAGNEHRLRKALGSGADEVVVDLEDAVAPAEKGGARDLLSCFEWPEETPIVAVRINAIGTAWCHRDLEAVAAIPQVSSVVLPKTESRGDVGFVERMLEGIEVEVGRAEQISVQALVETARGIVNLADIVGEVSRLSSIIVGYADLAASIGRSRRVDPTTWRGVQDAVVLHARASGVAAVDGPYLGTQVDDPFLDAVVNAAALGFDGKWAIHPRQVAAINDAFTPSAEAVDHARRIIATLDGAHSSGRGAVDLDGALVDEAMARDARRVLAKAGVR